MTSSVRVVVQFVGSFHTVKVFQSTYMEAEPKRLIITQSSSRILFLFLFLFIVEAPSVQIPFSQQFWHRGSHDRGHSHNDLTRSITL